LRKIVLGLGLKDLEAELEPQTAKTDIKKSNGRIPISFAVGRSDISAMSMILRYATDPRVASTSHGSLLHFVATALDPGGIPILISHGAEVDCVGNNLQTPPHYEAAYSHNDKHATALLESGADANYKDLDGMAPLHWCAISGITPRQDLF
jgi:hypothetical protein